MKPHRFPLVLLAALAGPAVAPADTIYYAPPGVAKFETVAGTIVQETDKLLEIATEDGRTLTIPRENVLKIIRDAPSGAGYTDMAPQARAFRDAPPETGLADFDPDDPPSTRIYHYGFKGGMNVSNLSVDPQDLEEGDSLRSYALGGWLGLPLNRRLAVRAEALYSVKGDSETSGGYTTSTRMTYIDVPVVAKVGFLHGSAAQPSLFLGPSLGFNLSASSKLEGEGIDNEVDVKDDVRTFDLGLVLGGGVDFAVGHRTLGVELRYSKGLSNVAGDGANGSARNDVLAILGSIGLQ